MAWNPKKWFGRGKGKEKPAAPAPQTPKGAEPAADAPAQKRGVLGRLFGRGKRKEKPTAPAPTPAPPTPAPAEAAPAPAAEAPPAAEAGEAPKEAEAAAPPREYPTSIDVEADGDWIISSTEWSGVMKGTIVGHKAKTFIDAYEAGQWEICAQMVADAWDTNVADQIIPELSTIDYINWH